VGGALRSKSKHEKMKVEKLKSVQQRNIPAITRLHILLRPIVSRFEGTIGGCVGQGCMLVWGGWQTFAEEIIFGLDMTGDCGLDNVTIHFSPSYRAHANHSGLSGDGEVASVKGRQEAKSGGSTDGGRCKNNIFGVNM
jgi:hypothetical protein